MGGLGGISGRVQSHNGHLKTSHAFKRQIPVALNTLKMFLCVHAAGHAGVIMDHRGQYPVAVRYV
jgi:hypothetical protein